MRDAFNEAVAHGVNNNQSTASIKLKMISHIFLHTVLVSVQCISDQVSLCQFQLVFATTQVFARVYCKEQSLQ